MRGDKISSLSSHMQLKQMSAQYRCEKIDGAKRESKMAGLIKWEEFRKERTKAIINYYKVKKNIFRSNKIIAHAKVARFLRHFNMKLSLKKEKKMRKERFQWSSFLIVVKLRAMLTKTYSASNIEGRNTIRIRDTLTFQAGIMTRFHMKTLGWH